MEQLRFSSTHSIRQHRLEVSGQLQVTAALLSKLGTSIHNVGRFGGRTQFERFRKLEKPLVPAADATAETSTL